MDKAACVYYNRMVKMLLEEIKSRVERRNHEDKDKSIFVGSGCWNGGCNDVFGGRVQKAVFRRQR